jgi:exopolyphosphatase/guanosine-5'-triphosphate,3'-diphosphate pyrophosphatase
VSIRAAIDIGTNSVKLLTARTGDLGIEEILDEQVVVTRLGKGLVEHGRILDESAAITLEVLKGMVADAHAEGAPGVVAVGTRVFRAAENGGVMANGISHALDVPVVILSEEREAQLGFLGATHGIAGQNVAVLDIGGGSSEISFGSQGNPIWGMSLPVGVVTVQERIGDPLWTEGILEQVRDEVTRLFRKLMGPRSVDPNLSLIGISGTITSLIQIRDQIGTWDPKQVQGKRLTAVEVEDLVRSISVMPINDRQSLVGMQPGREDVLPAGGAIVLGIFEGMGISEMEVRTTGLRHGLLIESVIGKS